MPERSKHKPLQWYVASIVPSHLHRAVVSIRGGDCGYGIRSGVVAVGVACMAFDGEGKRAWIDVWIFIKVLLWLAKCWSIVVRVWRRSEASGLLVNGTRFECRMACICK